MIHPKTQVMTADFRRRLVDGDLLIGTIVTLSAPEVTEAFVDAGYDYLFIAAIIEALPLPACGEQRLASCSGDSYVSSNRGISSTRLHGLVR